MARSRPIMKRFGDVNGASPKNAKPIPPLMPIVACVMAVSTFPLSSFKDLARNRSTGPGVVTPSLAVGRHWCAVRPTRTWLTRWHVTDLKETSPRDRHIAGLSVSPVSAWNGYTMDHDVKSIEKKMTMIFSCWMSSNQKKIEKWLFPPPVLEHGCCMLLQRSHNIPLNQPACSEDSYLWGGRYNKNIMTFCSTVVGLVRAKKHI